MMLDQELGDSCEIVGNDAPADPTFHACFAMRQAAVQMPCASQLADAAFNAITETLSGTEPGLSLVGPAMVGLVTGLRQTDMAHSQSLSLLLVVGRVDAAITRHFLRRFAKHLAVIAQVSRPERNVQKSSVQDVHFFAPFVSSGIC